MLKRYHQTVGITFRAVDACVIAGVWILSYWGRFYLPIVEVTKGFPAFSRYVALTPLIIILWQIVFSSAKLYQSQRMLRRTHEAFLVLRAHGFAMLLFISLTYLFSEYQYSRGVMVYFGFLGAVALIGLRLAVRNFLRAIRRRGRNTRNAIIIGEGAAVETLIWKLKRFPEIGILVQGVIAPPDFAAMTVQGAPVLGNFAKISEILREKKPDQILISLPRRHANELDAVLRALRDETVDIQLVPDIQDYVTLGCAIEDFDGMPIVKLNDSPLDGVGALLKRITDFALGLLGALLISPLLIAIALLVKLTSKGPIFYAQERCGLDGRAFKMWKFRSMRVDAEDSTGAVWAKKDDDRRTPIGTFLRSTSIDELPQLWNVIRGEMSLVGPRPLILDEDQHVEHWARRRLNLKPGITGLWQVLGASDIPFDEMTKLDYLYVTNWSLREDLRLIMLTLPALARARSAY